MTDNEKVNYMIDKSDNVKLKQTKEWWFDRNHQNQHTFHLASQMLVHSEDDPQVCVDKAKELVDVFYATILEPTTKKWR